MAGLNKDRFSEDSIYSKCDIYPLSPPRKGITYKQMKTVQVHGRTISGDVLVGATDPAGAPGRGAARGHEVEGEPGDGDRPERYLENIMLDRADVSFVRFSFHLFLILVFFLLLLLISPLFSLFCYAQFGSICLLCPFYFFLFLSLYTQADFEDPEDS